GRAEPERRQEAVTESRTRGQRGLGRASLQLLECAVRVAQAHGPISVRGVAYRLFVVERLIPSMEKKHVDKVGRILVYAREHGYLDWDLIVDDTRQVERPQMWDNLAD